MICIGSAIVVPKRRQHNFRECKPMFVESRPDLGDIVPHSGQTRGTSDLICGLEPTSSELVANSTELGQHLRTELSTSRADSTDFSPACAMCSRRFRLELARALTKFPLIGPQWGVADRRGQHSNTGLVHFLRRGQQDALELLKNNAHGAVL